LLQHLNVNCQPSARKFVPAFCDFSPFNIQLHELEAVAVASASASSSTAPCMRGRSAPNPSSGGKLGRHGIWRHNKDLYKVAARFILESEAPVGDLRLSIRGLGRATAAPPTVRSAPPAVSAIAEPPAFTYQPDPAARLVAPPAYAKAALARAEYRASLLADRPILDRLASPRPRFEAPAAERTPSVLLAEAERQVTPPPPGGGAMIRHLRSAPQARCGAAGALPGARPAPRRFASRAPWARLGSPDPSHQSPRRPSCARAGRARRYDADVRL
jgi:hypothetical protein